MNKELEKTIKILQQFNSVETQVVSPLAISYLEQSWQQRGFVEFLQFTCPPINARLLNTDSPSNYILTNPKGNNFESGGLDQRLNKLLDAITKIGVIPFLRIVIGDTDEDDYLFPVVGRPVNLDEIDCEARKELYKRVFTERIKQKYPRWSFSVERISEIASIFSEDDIPPIDNCYTDELTKDMEIEVTQMRKAFNNGGYYDEIPAPTANQLEQIVQLKFGTYAVQGWMLSEYYPQAVLLQSEFPLQVRTRMINILNKQMDRELPVIYPYKEIL